MTDPMPVDLGAAGVPADAIERLAELRPGKPGSIFTSDLSVNEFLLVREVGFRPLGLVLGSSIYHVGLQIGRWSKNQELDVLYAPGLSALADIRQLVAAVDRPVNVLALPGGPSVPELAAAGVRRVSVGGAFAYAALGATVEAARELLDPGTYGYSRLAATGRAAIQGAFTA